MRIRVWAWMVERVRRLWMGQTAFHEFAHREFVFSVLLLLLLVVFCLLVSVSNAGGVGVVMPAGASAGASAPASIPSDNPDAALQQLTNSILSWILLGITPFLLAIIVYLLKKYSDTLDRDLRVISAEIVEAARTLAVHEQRFVTLDKMHEMQLATCEQHAQVLSELAQKLDEIAFNCVLQHPNRRTADKIADPLKKSAKLMQQQAQLKTPKVSPETK